MSQGSSQGSVNPYVFIVGSPRSGTTLLKRMVNAHSTIAVTRETHWITRFYKRRAGLTPEGYLTDELLPLLFAHKRFPHLRIKPEKVLKLLKHGRPVHYSEFVSGIFDLYGRKKKKSLVADKTPPYVRSIGLLHELWPQARFVHLIRDGRNVCLSMLGWRMAHKAAGRRPTWKEDPVSTTALWWEWLVRSGRDAGKSLPRGLYLEMKYENLVADPACELKALCSFLDVPFEPAMLEYHRGRTSKDASLSANSAWLPPTKGLRDWRSQMGSADLEKFEAVAGDLLDELGLERAVPVITPTALEHAGRMREKFHS